MTASTLQRQDSVEAEPGEGTPLAGRHVAGRLWRRYGATPGLISVAPARRLIASASRFGAGRVRLPGQGPQQGSLLESIQRRFGVPGSYGRAGGPGLRLGQLPYLAPAVAPAASAEPHAAGPDAAEPHAAGRMGSGNPGVHGPTQPSPQALQARIQALLRLPLTARAVQAKTAGRESMALAGEIVERRRSGALERALQQAPEVMHVTAQAAPVDRPEPPPDIIDRELRRAVAPAGAAS